MRHGAVHVYIERNALFRRALGNHVHQVVEGGTQVVFDRQDFHLAGFNFGEVKNVVDDAQQRAARALNFCGVHKNLLVRAFAQNHFVQAEHRVDRRTDFVRHVGKECRLCLARLRCHPQILLQLLFSLHVVDVVGDGGRHRNQRLVQVGDFVLGGYVYGFQVEVLPLSAVNCAVGKVVNGNRQQLDGVHDGQLRVEICNDCNGNGDVEQAQKLL